MKLLILSDLHIDIGSMTTHLNGRRIDADADVVVLAGDIHEGVQAPIWARQAFPEKPIILVAGNHEFYGRYWNRNLRKLREKSAELGIHFLENDSLELFGVRFLGCTLWTDFLLHGQEQYLDSLREAHRRMNDFRLIKLDRKAQENQDWRETRSVHLLPYLTARRHRQSVAWLDAQLLTGDLARTVVVTHHAPHPRSIPAQFQGNEISPAYASDLTRLMGRSALWIHGHIHENADYVVKGTRVVCNPRGYPDGRGNNLNQGFNPALVVEV